MFSVDEAVDYLVHINFGISALTIPLQATLNSDKTSNSHKDLARLNAYKNELRSMPEKELEQLFLDAKNQTKARIIQKRKQAILDEEEAERKRFYNLKSANADFVHWSKAAHWTLDEAIALSFGKEPEVVNWQKIEPLKDKTVFAKAYAKRRDLALRASRVNKLSDHVMPVVFISWAKELHIDLPSELLNQLEKVGNTAINWRKEWIKLKTNYDDLQTQANQSNLGTTQKTENLLKAFASIAIDAYGYDPESKKSTTTNDILKALERQGKKLDPKTIRAWLKEGIELLPNKPL